VVMSVEDDGVGFDAQRRAPVMSFGLTTMRGRMESLGGRFRAESWPGGHDDGRRGTRIEVTLPLPRSYLA
jgi:signal transduction histidine kinase